MIFEFIFAYFLHFQTSKDNFKLSLENPNRLVSLSMQFGSHSDFQTVAKHRQISKTHVNKNNADNTKINKLT